MSDYPSRFFHIRSRDRFDSDLVNAIEKGYAEWIEWVETTVRNWASAPQNASLEKPNYQISPLTLSSDGRVATIKVEGDPKSHRAMMLIEDPAIEMLIAYIPAERLPHLEVAYENEELKKWGQPALTWRVPSR